MSAIQAEKFPTDNVNLPRIQTSLLNGYSTPLDNCHNDFGGLHYHELTFDVFKALCKQTAPNKSDAEFCAD